jgi:hypothetical protein
MADLVNMSQQFGNLPMESLIGGPLQAVAKANAQMVTTNAKFITDIGFKKDDQGNPTETNMVTFGYEKNIVNPADGSVTPQQMTIKAPLLAVVPLPSLKVVEATVSFNMQVSSSTEDTSESSSEAAMSGEGRVGWGPFSVSVKVSGKTSSHSSSTRKSDNSAKYEVNVTARDDGPAEGLMRIIDVLCDSIGEAPPAPATP